MRERSGNMAMRDVIKEAIIAGGATKESLLELTGTTEKGLASQFTYLRMMGSCPKKKDDGNQTCRMLEFPQVKSLSHFLWGTFCRKSSVRKRR